MKACYAEQMRNIDKSATENAKIPSIVLMENAALSCVEELKETFFDLDKKSVLIFSGKGNNGGDGFAIAKHLFNMGINVKVMLVNGTDFIGDAKINFDIIKGMNVDIETVVDTENLDLIIRAYDIVIDAIFGTGIKGELDFKFREIINTINENAKYTLSVDVPSGMNSDSGEVSGACIKADKTVTFAAYKIGMFKFPAADYTGEIKVKNISIPDYIIEAEDIKISVTDDEFVRKHFPTRTNNSQKGDYGKVLIIAGSIGMSGAAYLASQAAIVSGSGLVTLGVPKCINEIMEVKTTEVMTISLEDCDGHISYLAANKVSDIINNYDAVLIGPGLGRSGDVLTLLENVLKKSKVPVIIDADGINAIAKDIRILEDCVCPVVFTPHAVEMSRLTGSDKDYIENNRFLVSEKFSESYGVTLLLKGHHTIVTAPDKKQYINITGNSGLATGGSGDVLAGILVSLAARGVDETLAAVMAAHIHGMAGDILKSKYGEDSVTAAKLIECIPDAICHILQVEKNRTL